MSKQQWGNAVWFMFHTLAEKLRPEYSSESPVILYHFKNICNNLPCPTCSHHAQLNLKQMNTNRIINKNSLIHFLWEFHNVVNVQIQKKYFSLHDCRNMYNSANTYNIIMNFKKYMTITSGQPRLMINSQHKMQSVNALLTYLHYNLYKFMP